MDVAVQHPWILSCSSDRTVKVWDYMRRICLAQSVTPDDLLSCSMHPSGASHLSTLQLATHRISDSGTSLRQTALMINCKLSHTLPCQLLQLWRHHCTLGQLVWLV